MADEKKGITVKIDANLHAEIREYLERHEGMTMAEFITLAVDDELHPKIQQKEGNSIDFMSGEYTINNLNNIKSKTVGDGQHGTARWANKAEIRKTYRHIPFTPKKWRKQAKQNQTPTMTATAPRKLLRKKAEPTEEALPQGIVVGCKGGKHSTTAMIDTGDVHVLMIGAAGVGKTAFWLYPCIEYACASGMSFLSTDTKGDVMRNYGNIAKDYGYKVSVIDLRNPTRSNGNNILYLVNKYTDLYAASFGQNAYFYDAAEGLLTATILLVAEFCAPEKRHIVSVFKVIQELLAPSKKKGKNQFQQLMELLPNEHKAKWFAGAALNTAEQSMASVMSTALSRLIAFLDTELEQLLCFDTEIDAETFCNEKSAIFVIMPEENPNTFFMISLIIQQLYREILAVADENGGKLKNRCVFFCDEFGTLPKIESAEMMFSASRSRRLQIVPIIQSFAQLEKNYGKEGAEIIVDNTQDTIFGGFAPNSSSAETLSKALGSRTVMSGSVSRSKNDPSQSLQMIERPLLTPDELKSLPKGDFIVMKTGAHPMRVHLKLFFKWGIEFDEDNPYAVPDQGNREVKYADKKEIQDGILEKYPPEWKEETPAPNSSDGGGQAQQDSQKNEPQRTTPKDKNNGGNPIRTSPPKKETAPDETEAEIIKDLVETEVQSNEPS